MKRMKDDERAFRASIEHGRTAEQAAEELKIGPERAAFLKRKLERETQARATARTMIARQQRPAQEQISSEETDSAELQGFGESRVEGHAGRPEDQEHQG